MMDLRTLERVNREATQRAAREKRVPVLIEPADVKAYFAGNRRAVSIPYVGSRTPRGYKALGEPLFVDKTGFGAPGEPALTIDEFLRRVESLGSSYWAAVEEGQFQIYVQRFLKLVGSPKTGAKCSCKRGVQRDNCSTCEGTGLVIDFAAIRAQAAH